MTGLAFHGPTGYERSVRASAAFLVLLWLSSMPASVLAQGPDAQAHFERGVTLYDEGRLPQALAEFREAQRIAPSAAFLYNVAQVEAELGHAVEAVDAYEELLRTARTIGDGMRAQIDAALAEQRARVATLEVVANAPGAIVALDDVDVGTAPLSSVRVSAGEHVLAARANGYESVRYRFTVAGGATHRASLTLVMSGAAIGSLRVDSRVPGVEVVVDGTSYGLTPLASAIALASGSHHVEGRREAYSLFSQDVTVAPGSESRTTLLVEPDAAAPDSALGTLHVAMPQASATVRIDGAPAETSSASHLSLPAGLHDVEVHVADREPFSTRVDLLARETYDLRPPYAWTPEAREQRVQAARSQAEIGWGLLIGGAIVGLGGGIATIAVWADYEGGAARLTRAFEGHCHDYRVHWNDTAGDATYPTRAFAHGCTDAVAPYYDLGPITASSENVDVLQASITSHLQTYYLEIGIGAAIAAIGGIALVSGIVLVATTPGQDTIDRAARASAFRLQLAGGPGSLSLLGTF